LLKLVNINVNKLLFIVLQFVNCFKRTTMKMKIFDLTLKMSNKSMMFEKH